MPIIPEKRDLPGRSLDHGDPRYGTVKPLLARLRSGLVRKLSGRFRDFPRLWTRRGARAREALDPLPVLRGLWRPASSVHASQSSRTALTADEDICTRVCAPANPPTEKSEGPRWLFRILSGRFPRFPATLDEVRGWSTRGTGGYRFPAACCVPASQRLTLAFGVPAGPPMNLNPTVSSRVPNVLRHIWQPCQM